MRIRCTATLLVLISCFLASRAQAATLPDGRAITPAGFTYPVEGFASAEALSPDGKRLAVLCQDSGAIDIISLSSARMMDRLPVPYATGMTWTSDGLYVTRGYTGDISRFSYNAIAAPEFLTLTKRTDVHVGGLLNGIAEDPATHRILVARTAEQEVDELDDQTGALIQKFAASGQPFSVGFAGDQIIATLYNSDHVDFWIHTATSTTRALMSAAPLRPQRQIVTGPHPTELLVDGTHAFVANADGHDVVEIDTASHAVVHRYDLAVNANILSGQTPSGMTLGGDRRQLFVAESGFNDVAVVDLTSGRVIARIPTAWYPMGVLFVSSPVIDKDPRSKPQLWVVSAQGLGSQPDPAGEWNGTYTGLVQHLVIEPNRFSDWSATVARNNRLFAARPPSAASLPPIKHIVFIVKENKHFDEEFGDEPRANADPTLLLYGRKYTPNAHAIAERYTLFDNFMGDGEKSDFGHSWTTQGMANDYLERNVHTADNAASDKDSRVPYSIWPLPFSGEDSVPIAIQDFDWFKDLNALQPQPRINVSAVFGPRGQLVDELRRKGVSFRVYGEQLTMLADGSIASGLAAHAARDYPGYHIDFGVLDYDRARLFLDDVRAHGLAAYSYLTLPTDHTAGKKAGFYTPASYVASNDVALGEIIAGLSKLPSWRDTVVFVTTDDPQGTGDHVDSHRMPAFAAGPYIRRGFIDHTRYSIPSMLRTVELTFGLQPLNMYDAMATPMLDAFAREPNISAYATIASSIPMEKNPGKTASLSLAIDGPSSRSIPNEEWLSLKGAQSLLAHLRHLHILGQDRDVANGD